jgi:hypothetical protein
MPRLTRKEKSSKVRQHILRIATGDLFPPSSQAERYSYVRTEIKKRRQLINGLAKMAGRKISPAEARKIIALAQGFDVTGNISNKTWGPESSEFGTGRQIARWQRRAIALRKV